MPSTATLERNPSGRRAAPVAVRWQDRPYQQVAIASEIAQVSEATLYKAAKEGLLTFVRLSGRTLVDTPSLVAFLSRAEPWVPSDRGAAGRAKRIETARRAWRS